jgi:hypothetical protein
MKPDLTTVGSPLFEREPSGKLRSRIATVFPRHHTIVTLPGIHATQRRAFVDLLNERRQAAGREPLSEAEETEVWNDAVDLIVEGDTVQIRPDPENMPLAFQADKLLQRRISKRRIKFLNVLNEKVRNAVKRRGECWRIASLPMSAEEMKQRIAAFRIGIRGREIFYYNSTTGTRFLTCQELVRLGSLSDDQLRQQLQEIRELAASWNPHCNPEIAFFMADDSFHVSAMVQFDFPALSGEGLRAAHEDLCRRFRAAVAPEFRQDDAENPVWRNRMFSALIAERDEAVSEETLLGLSPEFFMQIHWLPGGRVVNGEMMFDEVFEEDPRDPQRAAICDEKAREFLYNLVRKYDDLEYVNLGRVVNSLARHPESFGRRDVYIAVIKQRDCPRETVSIIRMQKWGVREHLNHGESLEQAMLRSEEYTEFVLDRRLGCRHLGMNIPHTVTARKICERYFGPATGAEGLMIWSPYFERAYIHGMATDKVPRQRFADEGFATSFARLLGAAAAPNLIAGRCDSHGNVLFDDGDEVVIEDDGGLPMEIVVAGLVGTFHDFRNELAISAPLYAGPVYRRLEHLANPEEFARVYLEAFVQHFLAIQEKYRSRRRSFDTMFQNRPYHSGGSFAYRWEQVLQRLHRSDPRELAELMRGHLPLGALVLELGMQGGL